MIFLLRSARTVLAALTAVLLATIAASAKPAVIGLRIGVHTDMTRVVLDLTGDLAYTVFTLPEPYRVVIDLPEVEWRMPAKTIPAGRGIVQRLRFGLFQPGTSRLVLDVGAPVRVRKTFLLRPTADFSYRLVLDLAAVAPSEFRRQGQPAALAKPAPLTPAPGTEAKGAKPVIVIDAGHGGVDPGTIGVSGVYEKHITLAAAMELKRQLEATGRYTIVMTRKRDVFVHLPRRVEIARHVKADLFISLHADAISRKKVRGATVYTLSEKSSDAQAAALAAKENKSDLIAGIDLASQAYDEEVTGILIDLARRETMNAAIEFAVLLVPELGKAGRLLRKTHRYAGFRVLKAPDVPSVLVELGYLSNRKDERALRDPAQRARLMKAVVRAVNLYIGAKKSAKRS